MSNSKKKNYKKRKANAHIQPKVHVNVQEESRFQQIMNEWLWLFTLIAIVAIIAALIIGIPMCNPGGACYEACQSCSKEEAVVSETDVDDPNAPADFTEQLSLPEDGEEIAVFETTAGTFKIRLFPKNAPETVTNFTNLIRSGYYDGVSFHRVIPGFMIQGGDPTGTGSGGSTFTGGALVDEYDNGLYHFRYALSMANTGMPNSGTSQFFIVQSDKMFAGMDENGELTQFTVDQLITQLGYDEGVAHFYGMFGGTPTLDAEARKGSGVPAHTVFGQVFDGVDVIDKIAAVATDENDKPVEDVIIIKAYIKDFVKVVVSNGDVSGTDVSTGDAQ